MLVVVATPTVSVVALNPGVETVRNAVCSIKLASRGAPSATYAGACFLLSMDWLSRDVEMFV